MRGGGRGTSAPVLYAASRLALLLLLAAITGCCGSRLKSSKTRHHTRWPLRPGGLGLLRPTTPQNTTPRPATAYPLSPDPLVDEDYDTDDVSQRPPPGGWVPDDSKVSVSMGPCLLHISEPCSNSRLLLYLFHNDAPTVPVLLNTSDPTSLTASGLSPVLNTKIIIHGYNGSLYYEHTFDIAKAYLDAGGVNVLVLDWSLYALAPCYPSAVINTWQAGKCAAQAIYNLAKWSTTPGRFLNRLHIIGFSLGAHVAGFASSYLRPARVGRITGLDPALPFFASLSRSWKLDANDARFVDVIHTNVGVLGKIDHTGHVDFYVNGGSVQPACNSSARPLCNHLMAPAYFAESITASSPGFWGTPCYSFLYYVVGWCDEPEAMLTAVLMGEHCPRSTRGVYFVNTGAASPYALGPIANTALQIEEPDPTFLATNNVTISLTPEELENEQLFQNSTIVLSRNSTQLSNSTLLNNNHLSNYKQLSNNNQSASD